MGQGRRGGGAAAGNQAVTIGTRNAGTRTLGVAARAAQRAVARRRNRPVAGSRRRNA